MDKDSRTYHSFLRDESFKHWVLKPDQESNLFWQEYLIAHPEEEGAIKMARQVLLTIQFNKYTDQETDEKYKLFRNIITNQKSARGIALEKAHFNQQKSKKLSAYWSMAASFLLVLGLSFYLFLQTNQRVSEPVTVATIVKENTKGRKSIIILPDGTSVKLNSASRISYPETFDSLQRVVQLSGEAYFEVVEDTSKPFSVIAGNLRTTALGTAFNVQAWQDDEKVQVALTEGKVKVEQMNGINQEENYYLNPGQMITHNLNNEEMNIAAFDPLRELGWKDGIIVFHKASMQEFVQKLSRWYGIEFDIQGTTDQPWSIDGHFENESLEEILESLSFTYKLSYEMKNDKVILKL